MQNAAALLRKYTLTADEQQAIENAITERATTKKTTRQNAAQMLHNEAWSDV